MTVMTMPVIITTEAGTIQPFDVPHCFKSLMQIIPTSATKVLLFYRWGSRD